VLFWQFWGKFTFEAVLVVCRPIDMYVYQQSLTSGTLVLRDQIAAQQQRLRRAESDLETALEPVVWWQFCGANKFVAG
jgi:hypothetical protein